MPFAPLAMRFSTADTCVSLSPSFLPANDWRSMPSFEAAELAPCFIFTKNGFVSVLVIRPTLIFESPEDPPDDESDESLPQAVAVAAIRTAPPTATRRREV